MFIVTQLYNRKGEIRGGATTPYKKTPPIFNAKFRISQEVGKYPENRSADLRRMLTGEINIVGVNAFVLFDSGTETNAISPDFIRAVHIPLLELPNPLVLQMGTKNSRSCIMYGTNTPVTLHGVTKTHYFDVVNIDRYDAILGAPWLNANGACLDFKSHTVRVGTGEIKTFDILMERGHSSMGANACSHPKFNKPPLKPST
jgi:hypothetical protein